MIRKHSLKQLWLWLLLMGAGIISLTTMQANMAHASTPLPANNIACLPTAYGLEELILCITNYMPAKNSNGYVVPEVEVRDEWRGVVADMLNMTAVSQCSTIALPDSLVNIYAVFPFTDAYTGQSYCVAMEILDEDDNGKVDRGWGTFIVNPTPDRYLSIDVTHPMEDNRTNQQGIRVFQGVGAHTFIMAGANRQANNTPSPCQTGEKIADVAHCADNLFFPTVVVIDQYHAANNNAHTAIQFHGMAVDTGCEDVNVYITHGSAAAPQLTDSIVRLRDTLRDLQPEWAVAVPGEEGLVCGKNGTKNVPGRYLNSETGDEGAVCGSSMPSYSGKFIHIEQHPDSSLTSYRSPEIWSEAIKIAFPSLTPPAETTAISFQNGIFPNASYTGTADTRIRASNADSNYATNPACEVEGINVGQSNKEKGVLFRWDITAVPEDSIIHRAEITLNISDETNSKGYYAYPLLRDWVENQATWNVYGTNLEWEVSGGLGDLDRVSTPVGWFAARALGSHTFTINPVLVQSWVDDPASNHGILIANLANDNKLGFNCNGSSTAPHNRPMLTLLYSQPDGE